MRGSIASSLLICRENVMHLLFLMEKNKQISELQAGLDDADVVIRKMDLEARSLQPSLKAMLLAKLREYKSDLNKLKREVKKLTSAKSDLDAHEELLESGMADAHAVSADQRERLTMSTERLNQSSDRLRESRRAVLETEQLGVSILEDLHQQRETLLHSHTKLHGVDDAIDKSKKILSAMSKRMSRNKWIVGSVIAALVFAIILILYFKPLADAEGAKKHHMIELLKSYGGLSYGQNGSHFEPKPVAPPLPNKCDWEVEPTELDFSTAIIIGKGSFGEILKAFWRGTPVAVKRILPNLSDDRLVIQDFRHEVNLLVKLRHPNVVQFLGAVTERKPLMLITEYLRGGDLHQHLKEKGALSPAAAVSFALDIARGMAYLHNEPNVIIHRDLKPRNVLLVNSSAEHLKVGDFGLSKLIRVQHSHDVYKMTGETGSYRYMAPEVFKHRKYDKKVDVFSFAMILYEMLEGEPPLAGYEPYEAAKYVAEGHRPTFKAKGYSPELKDLTENCWASDMNKRPSFIEILKRLERIRDTIPSDHHWSLFS